MRSVNLCKYRHTIVHNAHTKAYFRSFKFNENIGTEDADTLLWSCAERQTNACGHYVVGIFFLPSILSCAAIVRFYSSFGSSMVPMELRFYEMYHFLVRVRRSNLDVFSVSLSGDFYFHIPMRGQLFRCTDGNSTSKQWMNHSEMKHFHTVGCRMRFDFNETHKQQLCNLEQWIRNNSNY